MQNQELLSFSDVAAAIPSRMRGRKLHYATVWRWASRGVRGVKLETVTVGGARYVTRAALQEFISRCSARNNPNRPAQNIASRAKQIAQAEVECRLAGI